MNYRNFLNKSFLIVLCLISSIMLFTACSGNKPPQTTTDAGTVLSGEEGIGNLNSRGVATTQGDVIYYKSPIDHQLYSLNIKTNESHSLGNDYFCIINANDSIYCLNFFYDNETSESGFRIYKRNEGGEDTLLFTDNEIAYPQISGNYLYYLKSVPDFNSGYSSYVYRASLSEGSTPELVCDVLCNSFYVNGETLYYGDVATSAIMSIPVSDAVNIAKESPLELGILRSSAEIGASTVVSEVIVSNMLIKDNILYFIDGLNQGEFVRYNLETNEIAGFNTGIYVNNFNIADGYIYYHNQTDYCIYRMKTDGTEVQKLSPICEGQIILSNGYLIYVGISTNEATSGDRYISICNTEGTVIKEITFTEEYDLYRETESTEEYYDDYAYEEELSEPTPEEGAEESTEAVSEETAEESTEVASEETAEVSTETSTEEVLEESEITE